MVLRLVITRKAGISRLTTHGFLTHFAANKGIGYGIAKLLASQGLLTVVAARNGRSCFSTVVASTHTPCQALTVTSRALQRSLAEKLCKRFRKAQVAYPHTQGSLLCQGQCSMQYTLFGCSAGSKTVHFARLDITDDASVKHFAAAMEAEYGGVTILVNNAGKHPVRLYISLSVWIAKICYTVPTSIACMLQDLHTRGMFLGLMKQTRPSV